MQTVKRRGLYGTATRSLALIRSRLFQQSSEQYYSITKPASRITIRRYSRRRNQTSAIVGGFETSRGAKQPHSDRLPIILQLGTSSSQTLIRRIKTMKSYIQHLNERATPSFAIASTDMVSSDIESKRSKRREFERSMSDPLLLEPGTAQRRRGERRRVRVSQIKQADAAAAAAAVNTRKSMGRRGSLEKARSMSNVLNSNRKSFTNAAKPTRRGSIVEDQQQQKQQPADFQSTSVLNATRPSRRDSMTKMRSCSCVMNSNKRSFSNATKPTRRGSIVEQQQLQQDAEHEVPEPPLPSVVEESVRPSRRASMTKIKSCSDLRSSQKNLEFRASILYKALDDMGLFDDEDEETIPTTIF